MGAGFDWGWEEGRPGCGGLVWAEAGAGPSGRSRWGWSDTGKSYERSSKQVLFLTTSSRPGGRTVLCALAMQSKTGREGTDRCSLPRRGRIPQTEFA